MTTITKKTRQNRARGLFCALLLLFPLFVAPVRAALPAKGTALATQGFRGPLKVSSNGRYLTYTDGTPFFYLADTGWEIYKRLKREEVDYYLQKRASQGFTVIQTTALSQYDGLRAPNFYGHLPLHNMNPARPNDAYFQHVDYVVNKTQELGMYTAMMPTWGDKWNDAWGIGPLVFNPTNARTYGAWIGNRYKGKAVIWVLGGDRIPSTTLHYEIIKAMAEGIRSAVGSSQLITYHPHYGRSSAEFFHNAPWLDLNFVQSGNKTARNYLLINAGYVKTPAKPIVDSEPIYEGSTTKDLTRAPNGIVDAYPIRQTAYWSLFAGAFGYAYGNLTVFMFKRYSTPNYVQQLSAPGGVQMTYVRRLMESRRMLSIVPDQGLIAAGQGDGDSYLVSCRGADFAFAYAGTGQNFTVRLGRFPGTRVNAWWYNPRTGKATWLGNYSNSGTRSFDPPGYKARANDWILILDDAAKNYAAPDGTRPGTISTPGATCAATGTILRELWTNAPGNSIADVPVSRTPTLTSQLTTLETPADRGDHYGTRVRGYVCPPATGNYTFWIAGDDIAELWLSTNDQPAGKVKIAHTFYTAWREWTKYASQRSASIYLEAGKKYYLEVLHKEATGRDGVSVGWQLPNGTLERPIPGSRLSPYAASAARTDSQPEDQSQEAPEAEATRVFPNPADDQVTFAFTAKKTGPVDVLIFDAVGREAKRVRVQTRPGRTTVVIPVADLAPGFYFIRGGSDVTRKLVIDR